MSGLSSIAGSAVRWSAISQLVLRLGQVITTAILARLLLPSEFGLVGMATVVVEFALIFRDLGTSAAIIHREEVHQRLLSSVFWVNLCIGIVAALSIVLFAPLVAQFYDEPRLVLVLRVLAAAFVFASASVLQQALLERRVAFEVLAKCEAGAFACGAITAITMGMTGFGIWSLVSQTVVMQAALCLFLWRVGKWRPSFVISLQDINEIRSYSLNLAGSHFLTFVNRNADYILIGRFLGAEALGIYTIAYRLMFYPIVSVTLVVNRALFPVYARMKNDNARFRLAYTRVAGAIAAITFPVLLGVMALSEPFVLSLLGEKWLPVAGLLLILAPIGLSQSVGSTVALIYRTKDRTDMMLRWALFITVVTTAAYAIGVQWGLYGIAGAYLIVHVLMLYPFYRQPFQLIELKWGDFLRPLATPLVASAIMVLVIGFVLRFSAEKIGHGGQLTAGIFAGALSYIAAFVLLNLHQARTLVRIALQRSIA